jgi:cytochrome c oxidase assembly protein subunit 15
VNVRDRLASWLWPLAVANLVANIVIVMTGGAVRLTGSGLGCPTWPSCTDDSYTPHAALGVHGAIEFGNRMLTFVLVVVAVACFAAAYARRRQDSAVTEPLVLSTIVALGIPAQAVIGGITVLTDLNPWIVAFHLLVSMAMIAVCVRLVHSLVWLRCGRPRPVATPRLRLLAWLTFASGWLVLYLGTVVTGSGPHAGDREARRTGLDPHVFSHVHAVAVYLLVALTVALLVVSRREGHQGNVRAATALLLVELGQGTVGFLQYFNDLPVALVTVHMLGAALTSAGLAWVVLAAGGPEGDQRVSSGSRATETNSSER